MNNADNVGVPSLTTMRRRSNQLSRDLTKFLASACNVELSSPVDVLGLLFITQETFRYRGILTLVREKQFFNAEALLRGLWESRITIRYLFACWSDPDEVADAYVKFVNFKWAEKAAKSKTSEVAQVAASSTESETYRNEFEALPDDLKKLFRRDCAAMCAELDKFDPLPPNPTGLDWSYAHEYDHLFRFQSDSVHGGLEGAARLVDPLFNDMNFTADEADDLARGYLGAAYSWMKEIVDAWISRANNPEFVRLARE